MHCLRISVTSLNQYLDTHFLSGDGRVGEGELVALAARALLAECSKAVRQRVADDHRLVVVARDRGATIANALRVLVDDVDAIGCARVCVRVAALDVVGPATALLAAVPVASRPAWFNNDERISV